MAAETRYLNTDLDVWTRTDPAPLVEAMEALGAHMIGVHRREDGAWCAIFEAGGEQSVGSTHPDGDIKWLLDAVDALHDTAQQTWRTALRRELNIGYDCGDEPRAFQHVLPPETLKRIVDAGASLRWTLYPAERPPVEIAGT